MTMTPTETQVRFEAFKLFHAKHPALFRRLLNKVCIMLEARRKNQSFTDLWGWCKIETGIKVPNAHRPCYMRLLVHGVNAIHSSLPLGTPLLKPSGLFVFADSEFNAIPPEEWIAMLTIPVVGRMPGFQMNPGSLFNSMPMLQSDGTFE